MKMKDIHLKRMIHTCGSRVHENKKINTIILTAKILLNAIFVGKTGTKEVDGKERMLPKFYQVNNERIRVFRFVDIICIVEFDWLKLRKRQVWEIQC